MYIAEDVLYISLCGCWHHIQRQRCI